MKEKILIFDASSLISFSMNGLLNEIRNLKNIFSGKFIITEDVKQETVDRPLKTKRYELEALNINQLILEKILELPSSIGISSEEIKKETNEIIEKSNNSFFEKEKPIHIIDLGEASCLALSKILNKREVKNILVIDERTTRLLVESPKNLKELLQKKLHVMIQEKKENSERFSEFKIIRSTELIYISYKKGLIRIKDKKY